MIIHEDFTRCECGSAYLKKEQYILARYSNENANTNIVELPHGQKTKYSCENCGKVVFIKKE